jgi:hypothetical protein
MGTQSEVVKVLRAFETKRQKATEGWRKLRNEKLHNLKSAPDIINVIKSGG